MGVKVRVMVAVGARVRTRVAVGGDIVQVGGLGDVGVIVRVGACVVNGVGVTAAAVQVGALGEVGVIVRVGARVLVREGVRLGFKVLVKGGVWVVVEDSQGRGVSVPEEVAAKKVVAVGVVVPSGFNVGDKVRTASVSEGAGVGVRLSWVEAGAGAVCVTVEVLKTGRGRLAKGVEKCDTRAEAPARTTAMAMVPHPSAIRR